MTLTREQIEGWKMNNGAMSPNEFRALCDMALSVVGSAVRPRLDRNMVYEECAKICDRNAEAIRALKTSDADSASSFICGRCGDAWRGQACVSDCPLWEMVTTARRAKDD